MPSIRRLKYKNYAGLQIKGTVPFELSVYEMQDHVARAAYLTAKVESNGMFGSVMNYDNTGMTAGLHQAIAVYPKELADKDFNAADDQGPLWKLLRRIDLVHCPEWSRLATAFYDKCRWYVALDGSLRNVDTGELIFGKEIRDTLTASNNGVVPVSGKARKDAESWIELFHNLMIHPATYSVQKQIGEEHIVKRAVRTKLWMSSRPKYKNLTIQEAVYGERHISAVDIFQDTVPEFELAMCMFWSNTVNAPGAALKKLCRVIHIKDSKGPVAFAKALVRALGNTTFGRWDDDIKGGRYQRTRSAAMKSELWNAELFKGRTAIMPKDLPG